MKLKLIGKRIILRPVKKIDAADIQKHAKNKEVSRYTTLPYPYRLKDAQKWIRACELNFKKKKSYDLGIELKSKKKLIGMISLMKIDKQNKNAEYWLGKKYWRQGIATEAAKLILKVGFKKLKLERIYARVFNPNRVSAKFLRKMGFRYEGRLRKNVRNKGRWFDALYFGMLKEEYKKGVK